jgi:leucyl-tRNA synthetase
MVLAPEHPLISKLTTTECKLAVTKYIEFVAHESEIERLSTEKEKTGVFIGSYAINPYTNEQMEIWIADYVLLTYGTGAIMAVPAHDERDCEFARKFDLPIRIVIQPKDGNPLTEKNMPVTYDDITGVMVNSGDYDDMSSDECWKKIIQDIEKRNLGKKKINYRLRDWLISRQRYWGAPIPIIHCETCGLVPVSEKNLPVLLPRDVDFKPTGESPLARHQGFVNTICPNCGKKAKRDVDTMDTFVDSSWYFLRYLSPKLDQAPFDKGLVSRWLPVDKYIGGAEHSIMHLLYARFITKALRDAGWLTFDEPFTSLTHQGTITNKGAKMSKSKGNVVNPDDFVEQYGADAFRMFLMFMGPFEEGGDWSDQGIVGVSRFLNRVYDLVEEHRSWLKPEIQFTQINKLHTYEVDDYDKQLYRKVHQTIKKVSTDTEGFHFHTGVAAMMELLNLMNDFDPLLYNKEIYSWALHQFNLLLAPYAPHLAEEIWEMRGNKGYVINQKWPAYEEEATRVDKVTVVVQVNGKIRAKMQVAVDLPEKELEQLALSDTKVNEYLKGKEIKKIIVVPNKLVSLVVG